MKTRIRMSIDEEILNAVKKVAKRDTRTIAEEIEWILQQYLLDKEARYYPPKEFEKILIMRYKIENKQ